MASMMTHLDIELTISFRSPEVIARYRKPPLRRLAAERYPTPRVNPHICCPPTRRLLSRLSCTTRL